MESKQKKKPGVFHSFLCPAKKNIQLPFGRTGTKLVTGGFILNRLIWPNHKAADHDPFWRLYLPVSGEILLHCSGGKYVIQPGNLYLIPPELDFRLEGIRPCSHYWVHFMCPSLVYTHNLTCPIFIADSDGECRFLIRRLLKLTIHAKTFQDLVEMETIPIQLTAKILDAQTVSIHSIQQGEMEFAEILQFIEENISSQIRIQKLAFFSGQPLSVFTSNFRRVTGLPPKQYISIRRINRAKQLLLSTNEPLKQIAINVGIPSIRLFHRLFRKYALSSPKDFRKKLQEKKPIGNTEDF